MATIAALSPIFTFANENLRKENNKRPNVILILGDDQGYGDLGCTGNHIIKTPNIDKLHSEGIFLSDFSVCPVSSPTRSSIMTGRESLRTGICDTYNGGTTMSPEEVTIAEILKSSGYATAVFGKWHLGDNYPSRPMEQGFDEALVHGGGGIGQPGDILNYHKGDSSYFNPTLWHNGEITQTEGYCSDVFGSAAVDFIEKSDSNTPFFIYLAFNAPHTPLQLPQEYYDIYKDCDPSKGFDNLYMPEMSENDKEAARKVYGMVTNIDDNVGRVMTALEEKGIEDNTLVIFLTDNGPEQRRYTGGFYKTKGTVYQGGVHVPCIMHMPKKLGSGEVGYPSAHIDLLPTISSICNVPLPDTLELNGQNILPEILDKKANGDRSFYYSWVRRAPLLYKNIAIRDGVFKLVGDAGADAKVTDFKLFNLDNDLSEQNNIVNDNIDLATEMKAKLDYWYKDIIASKHLYSTPITIGSQHENPVYLNRNDAFGEEGLWTQENIYGYWNVDIEQSGEYDITCVFVKPLTEAGTLKMRIGNVSYEHANSELGVSEITVKDVYLTEGIGDFRPWYISQGGSKKYTGALPLYVKITKKIVD